MTIRRTNAVRNTLMSGLNADRGASAQIQVRSGLNSGLANQGVLLAQLTGNATAWGVATNGVLVSNAVTSDLSANATGIAGHYQLNTSAAVFLESGLLDGTDGASIDNTSITTGQEVRLNGNIVNTAAYDDGV